MNIFRKIMEIESSINLYEIQVTGNDAFEIVLRLALFEYSQYTSLIVELNKLRNHCLTYDEKSAFVPMYKAIYLSERKMYKNLKKY